MKRIPALFVATFCLAFFAATVARAQGTSGLHFGVEGGITKPQGDTGDVFDDGWNGGALLVWNFPVVPVGLRIDGSYHKLDGVDATAGDAEVLAGTANVVVGFRAILLKPYFLAGVGYYRLDFSDASFPSSFRGKSNETGWNAGAGVSISLRNIDLIVEARYHSVSTDGDRFKFVPISVGLVF
ncbi:MAG TPA: outer membrane beta-barrel protein [Thermoanaerobaculia bacterium]|nr:outer membrane beta-barrel protein [Thermoanaerobaculia bacterium]